MPRTAIDVRELRTQLNIQVLHIQRILFDKLPPRLDVLTHQRGEDGLALGNVFRLYREQRARLRIHGRLPQLLRRAYGFSTTATPTELPFATCVGARFNSRRTAPMSGRMLPGKARRSPPRSHSRSSASTISLPS